MSFLLTTMPALFKIVPEIPRKFLGDYLTKEVFEDALDEAADKALVEFKATVATWNQKPEFTVRRNKYSRTISTDDRIWLLVEKGAKPHKIPKRIFKNALKSYLRFQTQYQAKTMPNNADSFAGGPSGPYVRVRQVNHPGFKGRNFSTHISELMVERLQDAVELRVLQALGRIRF